MHFFTRLFWIMIISIMALETHAVVTISDYIGNQSFSINEDPEFSKLVKIVETAKVDNVGLDQEDSKQRLLVFENNVENYKHKLMTEIIKINKEGARAGRSDGAMDGADASLSGNSHKNSSDNLETFNGPNYKPKINHSKAVMIKAFADGYNYSYKLYYRLEFLK